MRCVSPLFTLALASFVSFAPLQAQAEDLKLDDPDGFFEEPIQFEESIKDGEQGILPDHWFVTANTAYADVVLDYDENIASKAIDQLIFRKSGQIQSQKIYISGLMKGSYLGEWTNTDSAFPILTRFPDHSGTEAHRFFIDNAALSLTATPTDWLTIFAQVEYHEIRFETQDEVQLRKAYVTLGDLNRSPFYLTFGRKTINFGDFDQYNPFTQNINNHFFRAESDGVIAELGFVNNFVQLSATAITGGRHTRTADTANSDQIDNFAINGDIFIPVMSGSKLKIGGGYLHGTIYNSVWPHHPGPELPCNAAGFPINSDGSLGKTTNVPECRGRNAAWDIRAEFTSPMFDIMAEYTATVDPWPATNEVIKAWTVQGRYKTEIYNYKTHFSLSYSKSEIGPFQIGGPGGTTFDELDAIIGGIEVFINPNISVGIEYSHNTGFAPLADVTNSAKDAESDQLIIGGRVVF